MLDLSLLLRPFFVYEAKTLAILNMYAGLSEPWALANSISTKISYAGPYYKNMFFELKTCKKINPFKLNRISHCYQFWTSQFPFSGLLGGILYFIQILIEYSVSKQGRT